MPRLDRSRGTAALALVAALVAVSAPRAVWRTWLRLREAWTFRGESIGDARRRIYGKEYWDGIEALRAAIPRDGAYFLLKDAEGEGADYWIRFDLAPRRPISVEWNSAGTRARPAPSGDLPDFVVRARGDRAPVLLDPGAFWEGAPAPRGELEDYGIPANVDVPADRAVVRGDLVVSGWCQERGGKPCAEVRIYLDAEGRAEEIERFPRPDVQAAVAGIGDCSRAGYRTTLRRVEPGAHVLWVLMRAGDGRYRRFGPRICTVSK